MMPRISFKLTQCTCVGGWVSGWVCARAKGCLMSRLDKIVQELIIVEVDDG